jgi:cbb3-type cytochrome oxidase subunit 3
VDGITAFFFWIAFMAVCSYAVPYLFERRRK